jgi:hypothetical protein
MTPTTLPKIRSTLSCSRCRNIITNSSEAVICKIGSFPPRRLCETCSMDSQLFMCTPPTMEHVLPFDQTPDAEPE